MVNYEDRQVIHSYNINGTVKNVKVGKFNNPHN